ncbi:MAG TPA: hypothetical protein VFK15_07760 [Burkholderiales bacterium]|nr:hypothetical protein [Burkholderiales bacterium]
MSTQVQPVSLQTCVSTVQTILNKAERAWSWGNRAAILKTYDEGLPRDASPYAVRRS